LDEERIMVLMPPKDHALFQVYETIANNELSRLKTHYGRPYEIVGMNTARYFKEDLAAYSNSIIVNETIYVPLFRIKEDSLALARWQELMPGYTIKGFEYNVQNEPALSAQIKQRYPTYGWNHGDALHCRTRAVWDPEMLFISTKRLDKEVDVKQKHIVYTSIIDYSKKGLVKAKTELCWRVVGASEWQHLKLNQIETVDHFFAEIPFHPSGTAIEYYISAASKSGKTEAQPRTAPLGTYRFLIK